MLASSLDKSKSKLSVRISIKKNNEYQSNAKQHLRHGKHGFQLLVRAKSEVALFFKNIHGIAAVNTL